jgi:hypothetical protein
VAWAGVDAARGGAVGSGVSVTDRAERLTLLQPYRYDGRLRYLLGRLDFALVADVLLTALPEFAARLTVHPERA